MNSNKYAVYLHPTQKENATTPKFRIAIGGCQTSCVQYLCSDCAAFAAAVAAVVGSPGFPSPSLESVAAIDCARHNQSRAQVFEDSLPLCQLLSG